MHIFGKNLHAGPNGPKCRKWEHYLGRLSTILTHSQGFLWHGGKHRQYTKPFRENVATTVGIFFDGVAGTLTYFKDGVSLGVAFDRLNEVHEPLYPSVVVVVVVVVVLVVVNVIGKLIVLHLFLLHGTCFRVKP